MISLLLQKIKGKKIETLYINYGLSYIYVLLSLLSFVLHFSFLAIDDEFLTVNCRTTFLNFKIYHFEYSFFIFIKIHNYFQLYPLLYY